MKIEIDREQFDNDLYCIESYFKCLGASDSTDCLDALTRLKALIAPSDIDVELALENQQGHLSDIMNSYTWTDDQTTSYDTLCNLIKMLTAAKEELDK